MANELPGQPPFPSGIDSKSPQGHRGSGYGRHEKPAERRSPRSRRSPAWACASFTSSSTASRRRLSARRSSCSSGSGSSSRFERAARHEASRLPRPASRRNPRASRRPHDVRLRPHVGRLGGRLRRVAEPAARWRLRRDARHAVLRKPPARSERTHLVDPPAWPLGDERLRAPRRDRRGMRRSALHPSRERRPSRARERLRGARSQALAAARTHELRGTADGRRARAALQPLARGRAGRSCRSRSTATASSCRLATRRARTSSSSRTAPSSTCRRTKRS